MAVPSKKDFLAKRRRREAEQAHQTKVTAEVERLRIKEQARLEFASELNRGGYALPDPGHTLKEDLKKPPRPIKWTIESFHEVGFNSLLVAQFKAGKTTLLLNLLKALADNEDFLGKFPIVKPLAHGEKVAFLNYELTEDTFIDWARELKIKHTERIVTAHLRGSTLPFWLPEGADKFVEWLTEANVKFLIVDPAAAAWQGAVENESDNNSVRRFLTALDHVKKRASVPDCILTAHMGRAQFEEGQERARGSALEEWMDAGWYLSMDASGIRSLRAMGRIAPVEAFDLKWTEATRSLEHSGHTRRQRTSQSGIQKVVEALLKLRETGDDHYPAKSKVLEHAIKGDANKRIPWRDEAEDKGFIESEQVGRARLYKLTAKGEELASHSITLPSTLKHGAGPKSDEDGEDAPSSDGDGSGSPAIVLPLRRHKHGGRAGK